VRTFGGISGGRAVTEGLAQSVHGAVHKLTTDSLSCKLSIERLSAPSRWQMSARLDCCQTGLTEPGAPSGYVNDPRGPQGQSHSHYGSGSLVTEQDREFFRKNLPTVTHMAAVNDAIARGCSAQLIRDHLGSL
jgi:hypothetical protein